MLATAQTLCLTTFPTALGWMAAAGRGDVLFDLTFGYDSPQTALAALRSEAGDALSLAEPDGWNPRLVRRLQAFAAGAFDDFRDVVVDTTGLSDFQQSVVEHCRRIPFGETLTYGQLAAHAGSPRAARAVGNVMATNRTPLIVPCHRVVAAGGQIGNYSAGGGRRMKLRLLETEALAVGS